MRVTRFSAIAAFAAASLFLVGSQSQAGFIGLPSNLGVLTTPGNFTSVADKTFTFLSYSGTTIGGTAIPAGSIAVTGIAGPPIGFELTGPITAIAGTSNDIALSYTVSSSGPAITAVTLNANGAVIGGTGAATVVEDVYTDATKSKFLGQLQLSAGTATLSLGAAYASLFITKDISVVGGTGTATFSIIDQTFTQTTTPEPASVVMMGLGLVGALGVVRLRRKAVTA